MQRLRERVARTPGRIALVGVSPMTERAAVSLAQAGLGFVVVNRTPEKAAALAARHSAEHMSLDAFRREPPTIEALLTATGAGTPILTQASLERLAAHTPSGQPPLIVDMAVPGDVDPAICNKLAIPRVGMDEIVRLAIKRMNRTKGRRQKQAEPLNRTSIDRMIAGGSFFRDPVLTASMKHARLRRLHLMGLLGDGGVHSMNTHLYALLEMAKREGVAEVCLHCFMDGRDTPPDSGAGFIEQLQKEIRRIGVAPDHPRALVNAP